MCTIFISLFTFKKKKSSKWFTIIPYFSLFYLYFYDNWSIKPIIKIKNQVIKPHSISKTWFFSIPNSAPFTSKTFFIRNKKYLGPNSGPIHISSFSSILKQELYSKHEHILTTANRLHYWDPSQIPICLSIPKWSKILWTLECMLKIHFIYHIWPQ